jgi:hypothetical protein
MGSRGGPGVVSPSLGLLLRLVVGAWNAPFFLGLAAGSHCQGSGLGIRKPCFSKMCVGVISATVHVQGVMNFRKRKGLFGLTVLAP